MRNLSREKCFDYSIDELLGVMRFDFYNGKLANQWKPKDLIIKLNTEKKIDLNKLQKEINYILFDLINNFENVVMLCNGVGYDNETLFYFVGNVGKYVIKLIPEEDNYSYIYCYLK